MFLAKTNIVLIYKDTIFSLH